MLNNGFQNEERGQWSVKIAAFIYIHSSIGQSTTLIMWKFQVRVLVDVPEFIHGKIECLIKLFNAIACESSGISLHS